MKLLLLLLTVSCVNVPNKIQHDVSINGLELSDLAGQCFTENFDKDDFLACLEFDLSEGGYVESFTKPL